MYQQSRICQRILDVKCQQCLFADWARQNQHGQDGVRYPQRYLQVYSHAFVQENLQATFQQTMHIILAPVKWKHALIYIGVAIIFFKRLEEHLQHVTSGLQPIQKARMTLKLKKGFFFSDNVDYVWYVMTPQCLHIITKIIDAVSDLNYPKTTSEVRALLRLCNEYRQFIPVFLQVAPL